MAVASLICLCEHCFGEGSFVNAGKVDSALTFCFHVTFFTEATVFMATSSKGDNPHARILLPTFAVQFLIAEARGLSFGFLGPFESQRVLFCVRHLLVLPQSFFLLYAHLFHSSFLRPALELLFLSRTSPASLAAPLSLWLRKQIPPISN